MAGMPTAAVFTTGMRAAAVSACAVFMVMVIAVYIRIIAQRTGQQRCYSLVRGALYASVKSDTCLGQRHLRSAADTAADQHIYAVGG